MNNKKAFSLVELIIVISILAILSGVSFMTIAKWVSKSKESRQLADLSILNKSLNTYILEHGSSYFPQPDAYKQLQTPDGVYSIKAGIFGSGLYQKVSNLAKLPKSPSGGFYEYSTNFSGDIYQLRSSSELITSRYTDNVSAIDDYSYKYEGNYGGYLLNKTGSSVIDYFMWYLPNMFFSDNQLLTINLSNNQFKIKNNGLVFTDSTKSIQNITGDSVGYLFDTAWNFGSYGELLTGFRSKFLSESNLIDTIYNLTKEKQSVLKSQKFRKIKSGTLNVWESAYNYNQILEDIEVMGLNTVNVPVKIIFSSLNSDNPSIDPVSKENAINIIKLLKNKNIKIILEPFPFINNGEDGETNLLPTDINNFFWNRKMNVLTPLISDIANKYDVDYLIICSNFEKLEYAEGYRSDTIDYVRTLFSKKIMYRSNWWLTADWAPETVAAYQSKLNRPYWAKVDIIAVAGYFELNADNIASVEQLKSDIKNSRIYGRGQNIYSELKAFYQKWKKPLFFGELGFPKLEKAGMQPWDEAVSLISSDQYQANLYQAYKETLQDENWFLGFSVFVLGTTSKYYPATQTKQIVNSWYK